MCHEPRLRWPDIPRAYHADKLVSYLADINSQTLQLLEANDFATLKQAIDARLQALRPS